MSVAAPQRTLALSGPMGVGKSTIGPLLAARAGVPFVDTDDVVAARFGGTVGQAFSALGEAAFRALEGEVIDELLGDGVTRVLALGGGAVTSHLTRRRLLNEAILVTMRASARALIARLDAAGVAARPKLAGSDPTRVLQAIIGERAVAYAECHGTVDALLPKEQVVERVYALWSRDPVAVALGARSYRVDIASGVAGELAAALDEVAPSGDALLVSDENVWRDVAPALALSELTLTGRRVLGPVVLGSGEAHKNIQSIEQIWNAALQAKIDRRAVLVALGGGVVGDLGGFAAATLLRGIKLVQMPTTLLSMVDASVGGKTGFDRPEGKNLVGAFHQPSMVLADTRALFSLPARELHAGFAEVVKSALLDGEAALSALERDTEALVARDEGALRRAIRASVALKARIVADDELETGSARATLNFGHTVGHALEAHGGYARLVHGEAVSLGMVAALAIGVRRGVTSPELRERVVRLLDALRLPTNLAAEPLADALPFAASDKKREGLTIRYVLVASPGAPSLDRLSLDEIARDLGLSA